jgi:hypothetical protein
VKKAIVVAIALAFSSCAYAAQGGEQGNTGCNGQGNANSPCAGGQGGAGGAGGNGGNSNNANVNSNNAKGGNANQKQGQVQLQGQSQSSLNLNSTSTKTSTSQQQSTNSSAVAGNNGQSQNASNDGNAQATSVTFNDVMQHQNTPDSTVVISSPTAPCRIAVGAGGSGPGFSLQLGGSVLDEGCDAREDSRLLHNLGKVAASIRRLCAKPEMAEALGADCAAPKKAAAAAYVAPDAKAGAVLSVYK